MKEHLTATLLLTYLRLSRLMTLYTDASDKSRNHWVDVWNSRRDADLLSHKHSWTQQKLSVTEEEYAYVLQKLNY